MKQFSLLFCHWLKTFGICSLSSLMIDSFFETNFVSAFISNLPYFLVLTGSLSVCSIGLFLSLIESIKESFLLSILCYFLVPVLATVYWLKILRENWPQHQADFRMYLIVSVFYMTIQGYYFLRSEIQVCYSRY